MVHKITQSGHPADALDEQAFQHFFNYIYSVAFCLPLIPATYTRG